MCVRVCVRVRVRLFCPIWDTGCWMITPIDPISMPLLLCWASQRLWAHLANGVLEHWGLIRNQALASREFEGGSRFSKLDICVSMAEPYLCGPLTMGSWKFVNIYRWSGTSLLELLVGPEVPPAGAVTPQTWGILLHPSQSNTPCTQSRTVSGDPIRSNSAWKFD